MPEDPHNLLRFLEAQQPVYTHVLAELTAARKRTHWMWFIFPQIHGLGSSPTARHFAIRSLDEAIAYLEHPILGLRLEECTALVNAASDKEISAILGYPDDLKFRSSITLFAHAERARANPSLTLFDEALSLFFDGVPDAATLERLEPARLQALL